MRLKDNVAIITGAGQGIGEACALRLGKEGARVAVVDVNREKGATGSPLSWPARAYRRRSST